MKKQYNVYIRQYVEDYTDDPALAINYEEFVGVTWAVSAAQAANNVRFRNGDKYNHEYTDHGQIYYYAIQTAEDNPQMHTGFLRWSDYH